MKLKLPGWAWKILDWLDLVEWKPGPPPPPHHINCRCVHRPLLPTPTHVRYFTRMDDRTEDLHDDFPMGK